MTATVGVGLIGLGTVGTAVARRLLAEWELLGERAGAVPMLRRVAVRDGSRARDIDLLSARVDTDPEGLVDDSSVAVVVELMGGVDRASSLIERALRAGKPVVTANKAAMAAHGLELSALAVSAGVSLRYDAAVGGAVPVVALLRDGLQGDRIEALEMVINGTTNFILTRMERDALPFAAALALAQEQGYAEADHGADIDGADAAAKLVLLSRLAFDARLGVEDVTTTGIDGIEEIDITCVRSLGATIKLVALAELAAAGLTLRVEPTVVVAGHPLSGVDGVENAVVIRADLAGQLLLRGRGAGGDATASAVVNDIVQSVRWPAVTPPAPGTDRPVSDGADLERGAYLRVELSTMAEADSLVEQALRDRGIEVCSSTVIAGRPAGLAMLTTAVSRRTRDNAVETLDSLAAVERVVTVMPATAAGR